MRQQRTRTAHHSPLATKAKGQWGVCARVRMRFDRSTHFLFAVAHSAECARGMSILDGRRLGRDSGLVRETRSVWAGSAHKTGKGGGWRSKRPRGERPRVRARNSEFPSYCARKPAGRHIQPFRGKSESAGRLIPSVETPFPAMGPFHCLLDHRFPLLVTLFVIIGLAFLFSHTGARLLSVLSPSP